MTTLFVLFKGSEIYAVGFDEFEAKDTIYKAGGGSDFKLVKYEPGETMELPPELLEEQDWFSDRAS